MSVALSSITDSNAVWEKGDELGAEEAVAPTLYGRSEYQERLLEAYDKLVTQDTLALRAVFVHGIAGSGKTALIDCTLREKVCDEGYFCSGKFFQNSGTQEPYSAIIAAFSDLCDLVVQSDRFDETAVKRISEGLLNRPEEARILGRMINLAPLLAQTCVRGDLNTGKPGSDVTFGKFKSACKTFLHTMASDSDHPVVLFIDDVQWADEGSRQLIQMLLEDNDLRNVMLILAYRDEEADKVEELRLKSSDVVDIRVNNLNLIGVHEMVCAALGTACSDEYIALSELVTTKTTGNPFYVRQFMDAIIGEDLIQRTDDDSWEYDLVEIKREIMVADTLADLLYRKIEHLSKNMKTTLTVASVFGYWFDEINLLQVVSEVIEDAQDESDFNNSGITCSTASTTQICLSEAVKAGFVERLDQDSYQFSHDKLQSAFLSFNNEKEEEKLHFLIGNAFLARADLDASNLYNAAVHLNAAPSFCTSNIERVELVRINLGAARYCREMVAFDKASDLLRIGLELLDPETKWSSELFDLTFEMTEELAAMELAAGHFDACKGVAEEVLVHANSKQMKINALLLGVECRMAANDFDGSILEARRALQTLDVTKLPQRISIRHVLPKLISVKRKMARKTDDYILGLPIMQDQSISTAVRLLSHICTYCLLKDDENQAIYAALSAMELTLKHGLSPYSSTALCMFGVCELSFGNHDRAFRYGKLAMNLMKQTKSGDADECPTVGLATVFLLHWKEPLSDLRHPLALAASNGLEKGDFVYGAFCFWQSCFMNNLVGQSLDSTAERVQVQLQRASALGGQSVLRGWLQPSMQFLANLLSESTNWEELSHLNGEYMQEEQYIQEAESANHTMLSFAVRWCSAQLAYYFGQYDRAEKLYKELTSMGTAAHLAFSSVPWFWFDASINYEQYRRLGRRGYLRKARRCKRKLERMAKIGCPNVAMALTYLGVKELSLRTKTSQTVLVAEFDSGIEALTGTVDFEAMANEDAGFALARLGKRLEAERYFKRAMDIYYHEWGSFAKYQWLEEQSTTAMGAMRGEDTGIEGPTSLVGDFISFDGSNSQGS